MNTEKKERLKAKHGEVQLLSATIYFFIKAVYDYSNLINIQERADKDEGNLKIHKVIYFK